MFLKQIVSKINEIPIFEVGEIMNVVKTEIVNQNNQAINNWTNSVKNALLSANKEFYNMLLSL